MRRMLEGLYGAAGAAAGACIVLITAMILGRIVARWFGVIVPSTEDFSGYLLAAASFLALAHTHRHGAHIRVTLLLRVLPRRWQRPLMGATLAVFAAILVYGAGYLCHLVYESWVFGERSQGYVAVPLWIPQVPLAVGALLLLVAVVDDVVAMLCGRIPPFAVREEGGE